MNLFEWLSSPQGIDLTHAVIVFLVALSGFLTWKTHQQTSDNAKALNSHLEQHLIDATQHIDAPPTS